MKLILTLLVMAAFIIMIVVVTKAIRGRSDRATSGPVPRESNQHQLIGTDEELDAEIVRIETMMRAAKRTCWRPVTSPGDEHVTDSKFGGMPFLHVGEEWPACKNCGTPLQLFLQLNATGIPTKVPFSGLLQFFYCTSMTADCEAESEAWTPGSKSTLLRIVTPDGPDRQIPVLPASASLPVRTIHSWTELPDYPHPEDAAMLGIMIPTYLIDDIYEKYHPEEGDKLLGWPSWVQGAEYPTCRQCQSPMQVLVQIASEDNLPYMFGDLGTGHISLCPNHIDEITFGWACS